MLHQIDALDDAQIIMTRLTEGNKHPEASSKGAPEVVSLISDSETLLLRNVAGTLRVLFHFRYAAVKLGSLALLMWSSHACLSA